jgi:hypothetical protein
VIPFALASTDARDPNLIVRIDLRLEWDGRSGIQTRTIETFRFVNSPSVPTRSLEDQLRALD